MPGENVELYIPRILGNVTREHIIETFRYLDIGDVKHLDMHKKINQNGYAYSFVFITMKLHESKPANDLIKALLIKGETNIFYNLQKNLYWVVKNHVSKENRKNAKSTTSVTRVDRHAFVPSVFTEEEKEMMSREFDEIIKEINCSVCF